MSFALAAFLLSGCSAIEQLTTPPASTGTSIPAKDSSGGIVANPDQKPGYIGAPTTNTGAGNLTGEQKLIKNGSLTLRANNIETAQQEIDIIAKRYQGYIFSMQQTQTPEKRYLTVTIKVQKDHFDDAVNDIKKLGQTSNVQMDVNDVTTQFIDTEARIRTLKVKETTLVGLLARATEMSDIIALEDNLQQTRQQIESYEGQLNALKNATEFSTISVNVTDEVGIPVNEVPETLWTRFTNNFNNGLRYWARVGVDIVSGAIFLIPILIPLAVILLLIARISRRNRNNLLKKYDPLNEGRLYKGTRASEENPAKEPAKDASPPESLK